MNSRIAAGENPELEFGKQLMKSVPRRVTSPFVVATFLFLFLVGPTSAVAENRVLMVGSETGAEIVPVTQNAENPVPQIVSLEASSPTRGGSAGALVVRGKGFRPESVVELDHAPMATQFRSEEQLIGTIPSRIFEIPATLTVTVSTPGPGGGTSNAGRLVIDVPPIAGRYVVFTSNRRGGRNHLFLFDRATSLLDPMEEANSPNANDAYPSISANGRLIVFQSDRNRGQSDIFLFDRETRTLDLLPEANHPTAFDGFPKISPDGRLIVYESDRLNGKPKIFLFDRVTRVASEISRANEATSDDGLAAISD
jgi:hypothetical protein